MALTSHTLKKNRPPSANVPLLTGAFAGVDGFFLSSASLSSLEESSEVEASDESLESSAAFFAAGDIGWRDTYINFEKSSLDSSFDFRVFLANGSLRNANDSICINTLYVERPSRAQLLFFF